MTTHISTGGKCGKCGNYFNALPDQDPELSRELKEMCYPCRYLKVLGWYVAQRLMVQDAHQAFHEPLDCSIAHGPDATTPADYIQILRRRLNESKNENGKLKAIVALAVTLKEGA